MATSSEQVLIAQAAMTAMEGRMDTGRIDRRTLTAGLIGIMGWSLTGVSAGAQPDLPQDKPPRTWMRHSDPAGTCRIPGGVVYTATPGKPHVVLDTINFTLPHQGNDLSPTVATILREGALIYAAGFVGRSGPQGAIFAVDNDSGEVAWQSETFDGVDLLALDEEHVIARVFDAGTATYPIIALDRATGSREAWRIDDLRLIGPPVVIAGLLLATGSVTSAYDLATGEPRWTVERPVVNGFAPRALAATADVVIACEPLGDSQVIAWRLDSGEELWRMDTGGFLILTPPMIVDGRIFVAAERQLIEIDGATGRPVAYIEHGVDMAPMGGHLAYAANRIMVRSTSGIASFSAIDLKAEWHWQPETWLPDHADILCTENHAIVRVNAELDYWQGAVFDVVDLHTGTVVATYPPRDDHAGIERGYLAASVGDNQLAFVTEAGIVLYGADAGS